MTTEFICTLRSSGGDYTLASTYFSTESGFDLTTALVFSHSGITGTIGDGSSVTQKVSGATGTCTHVTSSQILIHTITGTFDGTNQIYETIDTNYVTPTGAGDDPISVLEMYDDWASGLDDIASLSSGTVDATNHYIVRVATGEEGTTGIPQSGAFIKGDSGSNTVSLLTNSLEHTQFIGLDVENTRTTGTASCGIRMDGNYCHALKCMGKGKGGGIYINGTGGTTSIWPLVETCHAWGGGTYGVRGESTTRTRYRGKNNTAVNASVNNFLSGSTNKAILENCVGYNAGTADFSANQDTTNSNYNASGDTSSNVFTNYVTGIVSGDFNNTAGGDYHLSGSGSALYQAGTNLSLITDIDGDDWHATTPSIGFDEVISGDTSVLATTDSLILTEQGADVNTETNITTEVDVLVLTEFAASVTTTADVNVLANTDTLILTENTSTVNASRNVNTNLDTLILTEQNSTVNASRNVNTNLDTLILTENTSTVNASRNINTNLDTLVLTSYGAIVNIGININTNPDTLILTEQNSTVNASRSILATVDTLVLVEYSANISVTGDTNVNCNLDTLILTEQNSTVNASRNVNTNLDSLILVEYSSNIKLNKNVSTILDTLLLVEQPTTIKLDKNVSTILGSLILTEQVANITKGVSFELETPLIRSIIIMGEDRNIGILSDNRTIGIIS